MAKLKLKDKWEFIEDDANGRMKVRAGDTGNEFIFNEDGTLAEMTAKVTNETVNAGHPDFSSLQAALDHAETNGYRRVFVPAGTYNPITINHTVTLKGAHQQKVAVDGGSSNSTACHVESRDVNLESIYFRTSYGNGNSIDAINAPGYNYIKATNCLIGGADRYGIYLDGAGCAVTNCQFKDWRIDNETTLLGSNSGDCTIDANVRNSNITNNGSGNTIGDN